MDRSSENEKAHLRGAGRLGISEAIVTVAAFRSRIKSEILRQLHGRVSTGSDFEVRRLRARADAERKGQK